ncbi:MAG: metallophosphoesterase family protein [Bacteroidota bacterium]
MKIGFVADIHEDIANLRTAFDALETLRCDHIVCLGDIVGFSFYYQRECRHRDADACVAMIRDHCTAAVAGNHDLYAIRRVPEYAADFPYTDDWYELESDMRTRLSGRRLWQYDDHDLPSNLSADAEEYLQTLPEYQVLRLDGIQFIISHFVYPDLSGSLIASLQVDGNLEEHFSFMEEKDCMLGFSGHGHPEGLTYSQNGALRHNPFGSHLLQRSRQWVVCPAVAQSNRAHGVLTFDSSTFTVEARPFKSTINSK